MTSTKRVSVLLWVGVTCSVHAAPPSDVPDRATPPAVAQPVPTTNSNCPETPPHDRVLRVVGRGPGNGVRVSATAEGVPAGEMLRRLAQSAGVTMTGTGAALDRLVFLNVEDQGLDDVAEAVARASGAVLERNVDGSWLGHDPVPGRDHVALVVDARRPADALALGGLLLPPGAESSAHVRTGAAAGPGSRVMLAGPRATVAAASALVERAVALRPGQAVRVALPAAVGTTVMTGACEAAPARGGRTPVGTYVVRLARAQGASVVVGCGGGQPAFRHATTEVPWESAANEAGLHRVAGVSIPVAVAASVDAGSTQEVLLVSTPNAVALARWVELAGEARAVALPGVGALAVAAATPRMTTLITQLGGWDAALLKVLQGVAAAPAEVLPEPTALPGDAVAR